jgi:hypothetical protein
VPSPEHTFQPPIVFAPDNRTGGITNSPQLESPQRPSLVETSSTTNLHLEALKPCASALLGFPLERASTDLESTQSLPSRQSVPIDVDQIRAKRREQIEQTGNTPQIVGGAPNKDDGSRLIGRPGENYGPLSENGMKLRHLLLGDIGYIQHLPELAEQIGIDDLEGALQELRSYSLLDESNPDIILIISRKI